MRNIETKFEDESYCTTANKSVNSINTDEKVSKKSPKKQRKRGIR